MKNEAKQCLFAEIDRHLMEDEQPSKYFKTAIREELFSEFPFSMLKKLQDTPQSPQHHPEGNAWNHTMLVLDEAAGVKRKSSDARVFMWAALLHDIGKPDTTRERKGRITSYDHDKVGEQLSAQFLREFTDDTDFIQRVASLIRWHMQILFVIKDMPFADIASMKQQTDIEEVALLGYCDRMGRLGADRKKEEDESKLFLQKCHAFGRIKIRRSY